MSEDVFIFIMNSSDRDDTNRLVHLIDASHLSCQYSRGQDSRGGRHQTSDAESVSLRPGEAEAFVKQWVTQQVLPGLPDNLRLHELAIHHLARDASPLVTAGAGHSGSETTRIVKIE